MYAHSSSFGQEVPTFLMHVQSLIRIKQTQKAFGIYILMKFFTEKVVEWSEFVRSW